MRQKKRTGPAPEMTGGLWGKWLAASLLAALLGFLPVSALWQVPVRAEAGTVYSCTINRCYAHPVTGEIEDSGGEASYATGQGMVEGAVAAQGLLEITDSGAYYLTFRISLVDFTSGHSFSVQNTGESGWSAVTPSVTANGTDSNGTTSDLCIQVPGENCVVRGSMYVTPMGRDVVFYFYPNNFTEGNTTDMAAAMVTESAGGSQTGAQGESQSPAEQAVQTGNGSGGQGQQDRQENTGDGQDSTGEAGEKEKTAEETVSKETASKETVSKETGTDTTGQREASQSGSSDEQLSSAQGLSLSTAPETAADDNGGSAGIPLWGLMAAVTISMTVSGLILMAAGAFIVYYFRKNWRRWGGYDEEDYEEYEEDGE